MRNTRDDSLSFLSKRGHTRKWIVSIFWALVALLFINKLPNFIIWMPPWNSHMWISVSQLATKLPLWRAKQERIQRHIPIDKSKVRDSVLVSGVCSLWFTWRVLYLPEFTNSVASARNKESTIGMYIKSFDGALMFFESVNTLPSEFPWCLCWYTFYKGRWEREFLIIRKVRSIPRKFPIHGGRGNAFGVLCLFSSAPLWCEKEWELVTPKMVGQHALFSK